MLIMFKIKIKCVAENVRDDVAIDYEKYYLNNN